MQEFYVQFHSFQDVQDFIALATEHSFPITAGSDSYHVNGSSFMGMFTLDYSKPIRITVTCTPEEMEAFLQKLTRFLVK